MYLLHKNHCKNLVNNPNYIKIRGKYCTRSNFSSIIVRIYTIGNDKGFRVIYILFIKKRGSRVKNGRFGFKISHFFRER